ncbi:benzoate transporter [Pantoea sp. LMR881]|uniref:benzoate transporter n=1 Tax=Pantoea sp. LMR881 TaxID=3014336 RepID=UPI0022AFF89C|nr:benzoate transporter [Pantoea sp. LMR881]MCZ4061209.1 benzoate transporter [Pantoea sp. LMR881]MCZ4061321.1 benzoate transporter [Pantoea sp. LMR881]
MIYDCFLYYDEDMLLELRLNTLHQHVDKFVIVESLYTFTGLKREKLNFDIEKFSRFREKIIYVVNDTPPRLYAATKYAPDGDVDSWENEAIARNSIMKGLVGAKDDDIIIVSDVDELYRPEVIEKFSPRRLCTTIYMDFYNFKFNVKVLNDDGTSRQCKLPKMVTYKNLKGFFLGQPELLRNVKRVGTPIRRSWWLWNRLKWQTKIIHNGGWHFSWVMTDARISEKMSTISHTEYDLPEFNNPDHIRNCVENNIDIWNRPRKMEIIPVTKTNFPEWLVDNKERFAEFIK